MKLVTKFYVCGLTCWPGGENCNNYCNHDKSKPMPDKPGTYDTLKMEEIDMWKDVLEIVAGYTSQEKSVFDILKEKYTIKPNTNEQ